MTFDPLQILCIEPRFPGRLGAVVDWLVRKRGCNCRFYCASAEPREHWPQAAGKGMEIIAYQTGGAAREPAVSWMRYLERGLCYAFGCWETLDKRRPRPIDLVLGRSAGLGSTLFAPVYVPGVPIVNYFDYFYHAHKYDLADEAGPDTPVDYFHWRRSANAMDLLDLENGVTAWTGTRWQRDLYPTEYHASMMVLHEGVDTRRFTPRRQTRRSILGRTLPPGAPVLTYVARNLDRLRGFDRFVDLSNRLQKRYPNLISIVVGGAPVSRGLDFRFFNKDYGAHVLSQTPPHDGERFWMLGSVPPTIVAEVLSISDLHVYPGRAYPVSRSLLEALASGCVVLSADTEPVREVIEHEQTGLLADGRDAEAMETQASAVLEDREKHRALGEAAARMAQERYSQDVTLPRLAESLQKLVEQGNST